MLRWTDKGAAHRDIRALRLIRASRAEAFYKSEVTSWLTTLCCL